MMRFVLAALICLTAPALGQDANMPPLRDPASVPLPTEAAAPLRLGSTAPIRRFGEVFDQLAATGAIPVIGPGVTLEIRAAADRARVFLAYTQFDLDGDGQVTRSEYDLHARMSWGADLTEREYAILDSEWAAVDVGDSGAITLDDIRVLALEAHPVPATGPLGVEGEAMLQMDLDNDGFVIWDEVEAVLNAYKH
jgi:hypothetical protein